MTAVLVIEDDSAIREALARSLATFGLSVRTVATGADGLTAAVAWSPDVIILDLGLPDLDGEAVLRMLRGVTDAPVVVATARDDEETIIRLLDAGADDYLVKPLSGEHLAARIRAVLRRRAAVAGEGSSVMRVGGLEVDSRQRTAFLDGTLLELTRLEFDLLAHLVGRAGEVVSRRELLAEVWRQPYGGGDKTIDVHLSWLRRKLGETAASPRYLHTVRGVGVKLVSP